MIKETMLSFHDLFMSVRYMILSFFLDNWNLD